MIAQVEAEKLSVVIMAAVREYYELLAAGTPKDQADAALEATIRQKWPKGREEPWRYLCEECSDTGLRLVLKQTKVYADPVRFGEPCWCDKGKRFCPKPPKDDDFTQAGKVIKQPTRFGGR